MFQGSHRASLAQIPEPRKAGPSRDQEELTRQDLAPEGEMGLKRGEVPGDRVPDWRVEG